MSLEKQLILHEGVELKPYKDSVGVWTIGVGFNMNHISTDDWLTLVQDLGVTERGVIAVLRKKIKAVESALDRDLPWWRSMSENRRRVFIDMTFNLGIMKFLSFERFLKACGDGQWGDAAQHMKASLWFKQVGTRAKRLRFMLLEDRPLSEYVEF